MTADETDDWKARDIEERQRIRCRTSQLGCSPELLVLIESMERRIKELEESAKA